MRPSGSRQLQGGAVAGHDFGLPPRETRVRVRRSARFPGLIRQRRQIPRTRMACALSSRVSRRRKNPLSLDVVPLLQEARLFPVLNPEQIQQEAQRRPGVAACGAGVGIRAPASTSASSGSSGACGIFRLLIVRSLLSGSDDGPSPRRCASTGGASCSRKPMEE